MVRLMGKTRITQLRKHKGWTQERLAERSGVATRTIQRLEGGADATLETLSSVADVLGVNVSDLYEELDDDERAAAIEGLDQRRLEKQRQTEQRQAVAKRWKLLYPAVGVALTAIFFGIFLQTTAPIYLFIPVAWWAAGYWIMGFIWDFSINPGLDRKFPLTAAD